MHVDAAYFPTLPSVLLKLSLLKIQVFYVYLSFFIMASESFVIRYYDPFPQRDLFLHVDRRGRQQEVRLLQAPAGEPPLNPARPLLAGHTLLCPVCCDKCVRCESATWFSCGTGDTALRPLLRGGRRGNVKPQLAPRTSAQEGEGGRWGRQSKCFQ